IRDRNVTGVQTCALPIWAAAPDAGGHCHAFILAQSARWHKANRDLFAPPRGIARGVEKTPVRAPDFAHIFCFQCGRIVVYYILRSEERRVGEECKSRVAG